MLDIIICEIFSIDSPFAFSPLTKESANKLGFFRRKANKSAIIDSLFANFL